MSKRGIVTLCLMLTLLLVAACGCPKGCYCTATCVHVVTAEVVEFEDRVSCPWPYDTLDSSTYCP